MYATVNDTAGATVRYTARYNSTSTLKGLMIPTPDYPTRPADSNSSPQRTLCVHAANHVQSAPPKPIFLIWVYGIDAFSARKMFNHRQVVSNIDQLMSKKNIYICRGNLSVL